jgi:hypothetical protein
MTVTITAFQKNAFQNNAFQIATRKKVGWGFRHTRQELEAKLQQQKSETFGLRWYDDYLAARAAAIERIESTKSRPHREALVEAVDVADAVVNPETVFDLARELKAAAGARRVTASLKHAIVIAALASYDDDEEVIEMLLLH